MACGKRLESLLFALHFFVKEIYGELFAEKTVDKDAASVCMCVTKTGDQQYKVERK